MTEIHTAKKPFKPAGTPKFEMPKYDMPTMEVPEVVREFAEKGVAQAKEAYDRMKTAAEEATNMLEDTYATASKGAAEFNLKTLDALRANINASFDYMQQLMGVKTVSEAVELSASHVRKQFDAFTAQGKELSTLATKVQTATAEPIKAGVTKTFKVQ
jgi:phasin